MTPKSLKVKIKKRLMTKRASTSLQDTSATLPTVMDHIKELQGRLFFIVLTFIITTAAAYPFFENISNAIMAPLQSSQELVYLTPGGAFMFIIKVCLYVGLIFTLPAIIYHLYRFLMPAVGGFKIKTLLYYTLWSIILAITGVLFAYFISLPASLHFLTSFDLNNINPMLTIDSYFSFVMVYLSAGAVLFQIPIVMLIINKIKPQKPKNLFRLQRHIILGSFIVAAIISPTPDALNQTLLASPMIVMYQVGIVLIWLASRKNSKTLQDAPLSIDTISDQELTEILKELNHQSTPKSSLQPLPTRSKTCNITPLRPIAPRQIRSPHQMHTALSRNIITGPKTANSRVSFQDITTRNHHSIDYSNTQSVSRPRLQARLAPTLVGRL